MAAKRAKGYNRISCKICIYGYIRKQRSNFEVPKQNNKRKGYVNMQLTGSEIIIECLKEQGVDTVFGYPGGAILKCI